MDRGDVRADTTSSFAIHYTEAASRRPGRDSFVFSERPCLGNADTIMDFVSSTDKIRLDDAAHARIGATGNG